MLHNQQIMIEAKGLQIMENILQAHPEIDAVFAHNDEMALGALRGN